MESKVNIHELTDEQKVQAIKKDQYDFNEFLEGYKGLIYKVASEIYVKYHELEDKLSLASFAFYQAIYEFDDSKEVKFITFATIRIQRELLRANQHQTRKKRSGEQTDVSTEPFLISSIIKGHEKTQSFSLTETVTKYIQSEEVAHDEMERQIAYDHFIAEKKMREIARNYHLNPRSVEWKVKRMKTQIKTKLAHEKYLDYELERLGRV